jgi:hypothetical protein
MGAPATPPGMTSLQEALAYVEAAIRSFDGDPPDSDFQRGYLGALEDVLTEGFGVTTSLWSKAEGQ